MLNHTNTHSSWSLRLLVAGGLLLMSTAAQAQIRYVGSAGSDTNACTMAAPCRTLQHGIDVTPAGGEVRVLDPNAYGNATINKSMTVSSKGATIVSGITVNNAGAIVALRGLNLRGTTNIPYGVHVIAASAVHIEHCTASRFATHGIYANAADAEIFVTDSIMRDNAVAGLVINDPNASPSDFGTVTLTVANSRIENNGGDGALILGGASTFIRSIVSGNRANGVNLHVGTATIISTTASQNGAAGYDLGGSIATLESSLAQGNDIGLVAGGPAGSVATISNSTFTNNKSQGIITHDAVRTRGNNTVADNGTDVTGTLTPLPAT